MNKKAQCGAEVGSIISEVISVVLGACGMTTSSSIPGLNNIPLGPLGVFGVIGGAAITSTLNFTLTPLIFAIVGVVLIAALTYKLK
jgi:hypothetical protein